MFCRKCGKELLNTAKFCPKCGEKVVIKKKENSTKSINENNVMDMNSRVDNRNDYSNSIEHKQENRNNESSQTMSRVKNNSVNKKNDNIILAIVIVCAVVAGGLVYFKPWQLLNNTPSEVDVVYKDSQKNTDDSDDYIDEDEDDETVDEENKTDYIIPDSDTRVIERSDLDGLSANQVRLARNELYARHGRRFLDADLQSYFDSCSWYNGTIEPDDFSDEMLNSVEKQNKDIIVNYETEMGYR